MNSRTILDFEFFGGLSGDAMLGQHTLLIQLGLIVLHPA